MAKSKNRRKFFIFAIIGLILTGLTVSALLKKHEPLITVQTEKVSRRNLTEIVVANGRIQPVLQVKINPEVSGEIIELPVREGQPVKKGELLLKIKPDFYIAALNQAKAGYESSVAGQNTAKANLEKAAAEFKRNTELFQGKLISSSTFDEAKASFDVATAQLDSSMHQAEMAKAAVASANDSLDKTTLFSPLTGTVSKLNSQLGERVLGTVQNVGTEIMTISDLNEMEARVDIGEMDVVLITAGQKARLQVDAFKDRKFNGTVTEIANTAKGLGMPGGNPQEATKFEVKIHINEKESFRPGMSVNAEIETRYRTNVLAVPIASVTTRLPKEPKKKTEAKPASFTKAEETNSTASKTNSLSTPTNSVADSKSDKKNKEGPKLVEVVFTVNGDRAKMLTVKIGISDDTHWEIVEGLKEGDEIITGGFRAISRDLEDEKRILKSPTPVETEKK